MLTDCPAESIKTQSFYSPPLVVARIEGTISPLCFCSYPRPQCLHVPLLLYPYLYQLHCLILIPSCTLLEDVAGLATEVALHLHITAVTAASASLVLFSFVSSGVRNERE